MRALNQQGSRRGILFLGSCLLLASIPASAMISNPARAEGTAPSPTGWTAPDPTYGMGIDASVPIRMDDGVDLVGDVQYPTDLKTGKRVDGSFPVLLTQTPYECDVPNGTPTPESAIQVLAPAEFFVPRGYIFATVCVRGTGRSGGEFSFWQTREAQDAERLVSWAAALPSSNGEVGLTGCSYLGMTQWAAAAAGNPAVKAMAPTCIGSEFYRDGMMGDGMPNRAAYWYPLLSPLLMTPRVAPVMTALTMDMLNAGPTAYDGQYWKERRRESYLPAIVKSGVPALLLSGYGDIWVSNSMETWTQLQNLSFGRPQFAPMRPGQNVTGRYQIVEGPWDHGGGIDLGMLLRWFDTWLRDAPTGMQNTQEPVHVFDRTAGQWVDMASYPGVDRYTPMNLGPAGSLEPTPAAKPGFESLTWTQPDLSGGAVTFTSAPTTAGYGLAGPVSATLYAASTNKSLELIARLQDVAPDGRVADLTDGYVIGSLRARDPRRSWYDRAGVPMRPWCECTGDAWMAPGQMTRLDVRLKPVVATIAPGHALRLVLTTQTPAVNCTVTRDPVGQPIEILVGDDPCYPTRVQRQTLPGTYTVGYGVGVPSAVNLPLAPYHAFPYRGATAQPPPWMN